MKRLTLISGAALSIAWTQDPVKVDSKHYKVEFENDHVRALRITCGPGEKSVMHDHRDGTPVFLRIIM